MNKIIVASYMASGSSAVTDLLSEYDKVSCPNGNYEYIFLHCPNGLFDLEDKLLIGNNALRSDEALRSFEQTMQDLYENNHWWFGDYRNKVSDRFMNYVNEFLSTICTTTFSGFWYEQEKIGKNAWNLNRMKKKLGAKHFDLLTTQLRMAYPDSADFYNAARKFVNSVLSDVARDLGEKVLLLDQLLLPHNLWRVCNYFNASDTRIIVVSRDPRDVFASNKYVYSEMGEPVPMPLDAKEFCAYYRKMRECERPVNADSILRVRFEDLVLHYDDAVSAIEEFCGLSLLGKHGKKLASFNPDISKNNVGMFGFSAESIREAEIIKQELPEYLYPLDEALITSDKIAHVF